MMFSRMVTKAGAGVALAAALVLGSGAGAYAHECLNSSRSDQGNAKAGANSQAWFTLVVDSAIQGDGLAGTITQQQADCIKAAYAATGAPSSFSGRGGASRRSTSSPPACCGRRGRGRR